MKIKVEGVEYEFPESDSLDMDEAILLERYSGVGLEDLLPGEQMPLGAVKAFIVIAILRAEPGSREKDVAARIGKIKLTELESIQGDDAGPPVSGSNEPEASTGTSGTGSSNGSDSSPAEVLPVRSGLPVLPTGRISGRETSGV